MWSYLPFLLTALASLLLTAWAAAVLWSFPFDGLDDNLDWLTQQGLVVSVDPQGPAARAGLAPGDRILAIDGIPIADIAPPYSGKSAGDWATFSVLRTERPVTVAVPLVAPPFRVHVVRLEPLLVGLVFWSIGLVIWSIRPFHRETRLFFLLSHVMAGLLAAGDLSTLHWPWSSHLFNVLLLIWAALALHFNARFPDSLQAAIRRPLLWLSYGGTGLVTLALLVLWLHQGSPAVPAPLRTAQRSFVALMLLAALALLLRPRASAPMQVRRRRRLLIAGMVASLLPLLLFSLLPEIVWGSPLLGYVWTFPFLVLLPTAYAYAVLHGHLGQVDLILNRSLVYASLTVLLLSGYGLVFMGVSRLLPPTPWGDPVLGASLAVVVALGFAPLRRVLQRWADRLFYGGWYDYRTVVQAMSIELRQAMDLGRLSEQLMAVAHRMHFKEAALLWPEGRAMAPQGNMGYGPDVLEGLRLPVEGAVARYLCSAAQPCSREQVRQELAGANLQGTEHLVVAGTAVQFWIPLVSRGIVCGLVALGERHGDVLLDGEDLDILTTIAGQAAVAAENVALLEASRVRLAEMQQMRDDLAEAHRRLTESREGERLHLARELHDGPMQDLYGVRFRLGTLPDQSSRATVTADLAAAQESIQEVINTLRAICGELRPPTLATFGLEVAIRSHASRIQAAHPGLTLQLDLMPDGQLLPEVTRLALFRIFQAALNNVLQHAQAHTVLIRLVLDAEQVHLEVCDDGVGFTVPDRLIELARQGHLGLLGIRERANALGGQMDLITRPGRGTMIRVVVPQGGEQQADATDDPQGT